MIEGIMEIIDFSTIYTLYVSVLLGLTLKYIWRWNITYSFHESLHTSSEVNIYVARSLFSLSNRKNQNPILSFIVKFIRNKLGSVDDPDGNYFLIST